jgi:hypothetical protein
MSIDLDTTGAHCHPLPRPAFLEAAGGNLESRSCQSEIEGEGHAQRQRPTRAASVFGVWRAHLLAPAKRACSAARCYLSASSGALVAGPMADLAPDAVRLRPLTVTLLAARSAMDSLS